MSVNYSIEAILNTSFRIENIQTVLMKGTTLGLKYHDHKEGVLYGLAPVLHEEEAAKKLSTLTIIKQKKDLAYMLHVKRKVFLYGFMNQILDN